ncbi:MAG: EpsI family protein [Paludibaculum sp.]
MTGLFRSPHFLAGALLLVAAIGAEYSMKRTEYVPDLQPLAGISQTAGAWTSIRDYPMEKEVLDELKADGTLVRDYKNPAYNDPANLYIAFFRTQRTGVAPHSPKHCLPANGWTQETSSIIDINVPGASAPVNVNRYIVSHGSAKSIVYYWYLTPYRSVASEYMAKFYLVADSLRYQRSDTAMVRIVVPITTDEQAADREALDFLNSIYPAVKQYLPGPRTGA